MPDHAAPAPSSPVLDPTAAEPPAPRAARSGGPRRVVDVMGTVVSIDVRDAGIAETIVDAVVAHLHDIDARFSPYRPDSEVSRFGRGEVALDDASQDLRYVLTRCEQLRRESDGVFDVWHHRGDGRFDPSGYVKGWAVEEAALHLEAAGATAYTINAGGDVIARGESEPGLAWRVGIRHPDRADALVAVLAVRDLAVATSGTYERGEHIHDPRDATTPTDLASLTVVGPSLTLADAYATIGFAMGSEGPAWVARHAGYGVYAVTAEGRARWSDDVARLLA